MTSAMYGSLSGFELLQPAPAAIEPVHDAYVETALSGRVTDANRRIFLDAGRDMAARGAQAVLLAGTDLFVAFPGPGPGVRDGGRGAASCAGHRARGRAVSRPRRPPPGREGRR